MTKDKIQQNLTKVREKLAYFKEREKMLEEEWQQLDDAEKMQIIKKNKISSEQLRLLNQLSEEEIIHFLEQKQREEREVNGKEPEKESI